MARFKRILLKLSGESLMGEKQYGIDEKRLNEYAQQIKEIHELGVQMTDEDVERLMRFDGIVRNRLKIKSTITNARLFLAILKEFGSFYNYTLSFFPDRKPIVHTFNSLSEIPVSSPESDAMSRDMKKRGFKFFGTTICYAHLQASGFINDHLAGCFCRKG
jgi:DNA-3-methyladenine glycosylase I